MSESTLTITTRAPGVAQITMSRPAVFNAFDEAMIAEIDDTFARLGADPSVRVIVLSGAGKHFSAGADLQWMHLAAARKFAGMLHRIATCPKPTVARVQGAALGGGVGLTCACDIAVAADNASFSVSEAKFGILPAVIGPYVTNAVGKRQAQRLALTATRVGAAEALAMGMVQHVVPFDAEGIALDAAVDAVVKDLLVGGPQAQSEIKMLYADMEVGPITPQVRERSAQTISRVRGTDEAREGFAAFLGKRPANWIPQ